MPVKGIMKNRKWKTTSRRRATAPPGTYCMSIVLCTNLLYHESEQHQTLCMCNIASASPLIISWSWCMMYACVLELVVARVKCKRSYCGLKYV